MEIWKQVKDNQPKQFSKLKKKYSLDKLTDKEAEDLMKHDSYKRHKGAIKQK